MIQIKGAGIAGSYLAYLLSKKGYDVEVYEMRRRYDSKPCGGGIVRRVLNELSFLKLEGIKINGVVVEINKRKIVYREKEIGLSVWRDELIRILREFAESEGSKIHYGMGIRNFKNFSVKVDASGSKRAEIFGIESSSRRVNIKVEDEFYFKIYKLRGVIRYGWIFPKIDGFSVGLAGDLNWTLKNIDLFFSKIGAGGRKKLAPIPVYRGDKNLYSNGVWKIGDSASLVDPLNYEGYTGAIFSAKFLAGDKNFKSLFRYLDNELRIHRMISKFPQLSIFIKFWLRKVYSSTL